MEKDYSQREVVDKLGIKLGLLVALDERANALDSDLRQKIILKTGRAFATDQAQVDVVLALINSSSNPVAILQYWRTRLASNGGIWLLTPKKGQPDYIDQRELIELGSLVNLVDNKVCSISNITSAIRFVIRRQDRLKPESKSDG